MSRWNKNKMPHKKTDAPYPLDITIDTYLDQSWTYTETVIDTKSKPMIVLDDTLSVITVNDCFYKTFQVQKTSIEGKKICTICSGRWNIASLREELNAILYEGSFFSGLRITDEFQSVGHKTLVLNGRQIYFHDMHHSRVILLVIEDVTNVVNLSKIYTQQAVTHEIDNDEHNDQLTIQINELRREVDRLRTSLIQQRNQSD